MNTDLINTLVLAIPLITIISGFLLWLGRQVLLIIRLEVTQEQAIKYQSTVLQKLEAREDSIDVLLSRMQSDILDMQRYLTIATRHSKNPFIIRKKP